MQWADLFMCVKEDIVIYQRSMLIDLGQPEVPYDADHANRIILYYRLQISMFSSKSSCLTANVLLPRMHVPIRIDNSSHFVTKALKRLPLANLPKNDCPI